MTDVKARVVADSIGESSPRLFTVETRAPAMIHQELLRHRRLLVEEGFSWLDLDWEPDFSYSVSSTRAVPFRKMLEECRDPNLRAAPVHWGRAARGMVPGDELDDVEKKIFWPEVVRSLGWYGSAVPGDRITQRECAKRIWQAHAEISADLAELMVKWTDPHKSLANRLMSQHLHYNVLISGTEPGWANFHGLRLDGAADPIVRALAEATWREWNESHPRKLSSGAWHLPYADDDRSQSEALRHLYREDEWTPEAEVLDLLQKLSMARCAHLSYTSFETGERMTVEDCLRVVGHLNLDRSRPGPIHASPAEHQGTPGWKNPNLAGNFGPGWVQLRKLIPGEAIAPLPEAYR